MLKEQIVKSNGFNKKGKRLGRGDGSGKGNYCTRGLNGQLSRSGGGMPAWFEGGNTSSMKRLPKRRGFKRYYKLIKDIRQINLEDFENDSNINSGDTINKSKLFEAGYLKDETKEVKILGRGELTKSIKLDGLEYISSSAKQKIEKAGGEVK